MRPAIYFIAKYLGLFTLSRWLLRKRLLILCYHGFETADEAGFMPGVFMRASTFQRRLDLLKRLGHPVLPLDDAVERLQTNSLPDNAVCITLDDGFVSTGELGAAALAAAGLPSTLYLTTYYVDRQTPIFNLVVQYMFWKTSKRRIVLDQPDWGVPGSALLTRPEAVARLCATIIDYGERQSAEEREWICQQLGQILDVDYQAIVQDRRFTLMPVAELQQLQRLGMDIQLHTHRHRLPAEHEAAMVQEIVENAAALQRMLGKRCLHFCYPSGHWQPHQLEWLQRLNIASATTCDLGMNRADTHPLALYRYLDNEIVSDIEFEAELAGFVELLRIVTGRQRRKDRLRQASPTAEQTPVLVQDG